MEQYKEYNKIIINNNVINGFAGCFNLKKNMNEYNFQEEKIYKSMRLLDIFKN